jgi:uncharacterized protein YecE (DUF72 family)
MSTAVGPGTIRVGPAGWDYPDWAGTVFPKPRPRGFDPLAYLAGYYDTIEINSTFYGPATREVAEKWAKRVEQNPAFQFTAKLWQRFTHQRTAAWTNEDVIAARQAFDALAAAGRLGAVLLQFPWSFRNDEAGREWLGDLARAFSAYPLVVEVRHLSWNTRDVLEWLSEHQVGLVNVDQPLFHDSLRPSAHATGPVGYVRLHGRNYQQWFRKTAGRDDRYQYLYTADELVPWVDRIREVASRTRQTFAVTNNHPSGRATANATMIESLLTGEKAPAPPVLFNTYRDVLTPFAQSQI